MTLDDIRALVLRSLHGVAPEADLSALGGAADLRDALDIDSMDFLRFVVALHEGLHVDVPERDYAKIRTLDDCVAYLATKAPA
jgi:acyl carrier protein